MARTRRRPSVSSAAEDDSLILAQRSRKGKAALTGPQNSDPSPQGHVTEERKRPLYHCNYCNKDISEKKRIKCAMCPDFDLCVECYSVGAEVSPHKSNHPYRVMGGMTFQLLSPDWNADEEILLLEVFQFGFYFYISLTEILCKTQSESTQHLSWGCSWVQHLISTTHAAMGSNPSHLNSHKSFFMQRMREPVNPIGAEVWKVLPHAIWWTIWKERNTKIFDEKETSLISVLNRAISLIWNWLRFHVSFRGICRSYFL